MDGEKEQTVGYQTRLPSFTERGYSPVRGNVCEADKRVPVFREKAVSVAD